MEISTWFNTNKVNSLHYTLDDIRKEAWTKSKDTKKKIRISNEQSIYTME
jgi:hypothetical protein